MPDTQQLLALISDQEIIDNSIPTLPNPPNVPNAPDPALGRRLQLMYDTPRDYCCTSLQQAEAHLMLTVLSDPLTWNTFGFEILRMNNLELRNQALLILRTDNDSLELSVNNAASHLVRCLSWHSEMVSSALNANSEERPLDRAMSDTNSNSVNTALEAPVPTTPNPVYGERLQAMYDGQTAYCCATLENAENNLFVQLINRPSTWNTFGFEVLRETDLVQRNRMLRGFTTVHPSVQSALDLAIERFVRCNIAHPSMVHSAAAANRIARQRDLNTPVIANNTYRERLIALTLNPRTYCCDVLSRFERAFIEQVIAFPETWETVGADILYLTDLSHRNTRISPQLNNQTPYVVCQAFDATKHRLEICQTLHPTTYREDVVVPAEPKTYVPEGEFVPRSIDIAPETNREKYLRKHIAKAIKLPMQVLTVKKIRALIDRSNVFAMMPSQSWVGTCALCGKRERVADYCDSCASVFSLLPVTVVPRTYAAAASWSNSDMRSLHNRMESAGRLDYSTRVPVHHANPLDIGIELELEYRYMPGYSTYAREIVEAGLPGILKRDSSIGDGAEFVTMPQSQKDAEATIVAYAGLAKANSFFPSAKCGMHIHLNREGFDGGYHEIRFHELFNTLAPARFLSAYIGKNRYIRQLSTKGYCKRTKLDNGNLSLTDDNHVMSTERYAMVSFYNRATIELRFFAATTNESKLRANIQFACSARDYTRNDEFPTWKNYVRFLKANQATYPDLFERIVRFRALTALEIRETEAASSSETFTAI
jgi:hypothetical protein